MSDRLCSPEALAKLNDVVFRVQYLIKIYGSSQELRPEVLSSQVSQNVDVRDLQWLIHQFEMADFSSLPTVELQSRSVLSGDDYQYIAELNTVCFAGDFIESISKEALLAVLLKETISALKNSQAE